MARGRRSQLSEESLLGSSNYRNMDDVAHFDISDTPSTNGRSVFAAPLSTVKLWWAEPRTRRLILGCALASLVLLIIIIAIAAAASHHSSDDGPSSSYTVTQHPWLNTRLPTYLQPTHQAIELFIDLDSANPTFYGSVSIQLNITQPVDSLLLHAGPNIQPTSISLTSDAGAAIPHLWWTRPAANYNYLILNLTSMLPAQRGAQLLIAFTSVLPRGGGGLYLVDYTDGDGKVRPVVATQFESIGARRAFPCFDEPAFKATFAVTMHAPQQYPTVLSNMPVASSGPSSVSGWMRYDYQPTVRMSTYLLAMVVADYVYVERTAQCGSAQSIASRVYAPARFKAAMDVPARIAADVISYYCSYFDMPYPLPKEDHIAIPGKGGAMENWGLITYGNTALLWDPATDNVAQLQRVAVVIAHELAHQWFGNLVTAAWWSQLWLNEGFATYVEYIGAGVSNPELLMQDQFISVAQRQALTFDSGPNTHPIINDNTITGSFDNVDYAKGGSVLRMMQGMLGEDVFIGGVRSYLRHFQFGNAESTDLFSELTTAATAAGQSVNVTEVMYEWTARAGYPLVRCSTAPQSDSTTLWTCTQARFYSYAEANPAATTWTIPLTATTPASPSPFPLWWKMGQSTISFSVPSSTPYVKLNTNTTGFFRVLYDASSYAALSFALNRPGFGGIYHDDRLGLVNDAFVLSSLSAQSWPATLNLSLFLQHDTSFPVWQVAYPSLFTVYTYIKYHNSTARVLYEQYMQQAMSGVAARLDLSRTATPSAADAILESLLGLAMVRFNVSGRVDALKLMFDQLYAERIRVSDINPNLIDMVLEAGIVDGSRPAAWQWVYEHFYLQRLPYLTNMTMDDPLASLSFANIVRALTASQSQVELQVLLDNLFDPTLIAQQHIPTFLQGIAYNHLGLPLVNRWLMTGDHFTSLIGNVTQQQARTTMIQTVLGYNTQVETITELALFFQGVDMPQQVRNATDAGLRTAAANVAWLSANYMPLQQYLESGVWRRPDGPPAAGPTPWLDRRLPDTAQPMSYTVVQQIDLDSSPPTFSGSVDIAVQVLRPTMHLVLHAHPSLTVSAVSMLSAGGAAIPIASVWRYTPNQYVVLNFSSLVQAQTSAQLHLEFSATLSPQPLSGLYLAYYTNSTGQRVNMAATQFESADARRAFPCFDEPAFKATFTISVHSSPRYPTVLSNMPASPPVPSPVRAGWQLTQFQPTVRMSSYLIALVVCDFAYTEVVQQCGTASIPSRVYAPAHRINETRIPARIAADIISYYCSYFDMPYPLPKEDHIYVPQFSAGAMENWGLITYADTALLFNERTGTVAQLQRVAVVIAHELAHQWFGNLVTAAWWSQLWLNEGFATYVEYIGAGVSNPELLMQDQFISVAQRQALTFDSGPNTHPIINDNTITGSFDNVDYAKGGSVLRMMQGMLGEDVFIGGVRQYLKDYAYGNAYSSDLFAEMTAVARQAGIDIDVGMVMDEWTNNAGYPLLNCSTAMQADGSTAWSCSQARFYSYTPATRASTKWTIRLTATTPASPSPFPLWWLSTRPGPLTFTVPANTPYVKLNTNTTGFFRVLYDASSYAALSFALNRPGFGGIYHDDRLGLVNDAFVLSSLSAQSWPATLNLSLFLQHDTSFPVWQVAYPSLFTVYTYIKYHNSTARVLYEQYMQQAMSGVAARLDLSRTATPSAADAILESLLGLAMVRFNVSGRVDALKLMFDQLYAERIRVSDINPNLIDMVLEAGIVDGSRPAAWQWVYEHFYLQRLPYLTNMTMDDPLASLSFANIVRALTASQSQVELQVLLDNLFDPTLIAQQHIPTFLQGIAYNHLGLPLVNRWLMTGDHFTSLIGNVTQQQARTTMIQTVLGYNTQVETITELALFFQGVDMPQQVRNATDAGLRTAAANVAWLSANYMPLQQYLESGVWRRPDGPPAAGPTPWLDRRLPDTAQPMSYTVVQQIDLDSSPPTFSGSVDIAVQVLRPTMHLVLHAHPSLTVSAVSMLSAGGAAIPIASVWRYTPNQYVVLNFSSLVQAQTSAQLHLEFSATLSPQPLSGLYLAYYTNSTGQRVNMAATQFESADARRAFPCFDEPAFKATFTISVHSSPRYPTVLSNMPASPPVPSPVRAGWQLTQFQPTVRMSSYLIALVVCDFAYTEVVQQCGTASIPSRVYAPAHRINETRIPARIAADIISYYCSYFDMPYPLPKEDHIYVPQFSAGAMENWGLITYADTALLFNERTGTVAQLQRVAVVIAHELAHQWFGNLVTAAWWSQLWLNEGFATYVEYIGAGVSNPELLMQDQFISVAQRQALTFDSGPNTHPIINDNTITGSFDNVDYAKGGSVLRMMQGMLGEDVFIGGVRQYLKDYAYGNAYSSDLFAEMTAVARQAGIDIDVGMVMDEWTNNAGYPLLNCSTAMQADGSTAWSCSQARFYSYTPATRASTKWTIRLTATTPASPSPFPLWWLSTRPGPLTFTVPANTPYVKLNTNTTGFFRVLYDASSYAALSFALNRPGFGGIYHDDRLGLVNDAFVLSSLSAQSWPATLNLSLFLQHDTSFPVWQVAYPSLFTVYTYIKYHNSTARVLYEQYMQQAMSGVAARLDLSRTATPSAADAILESLLGLAMVRFNVSGRVDALKLMFDQLYAERIRVSDINPNLIDMVLEAGIVDGSRPAAWQWVYEHFYLQRLPYLTNMTMDDPLASLSFANIVRALTASQSQVELQVLLDNLFDPTLIAQQHIPTFLQGIAYNHLGLPLVNRWLMTGDHFTSLIGNVTQQQARTTMIQTVLGYNTQVETITELALFSQRLTLTQQVRTAVTNGLNTARANVLWLEARFEPIRVYLESGVWRRQS